MKTICVLLIVALSLHGVDANAQRITFSKKDASMSDVFQALEKQAGYTYICDKAWIKQIKKVSVSVIDGTVDQLLDQYFKDQPFTYSIIDKLVVIEQKGGTPNPDPPSLLNIDGKIIDETGQAVPGVSVSVKGTRKATFSNDNGEFRLTGVHPNSTIVTTSVNYERQEVVAENSQGTLIIRLTKQVNELVDVVVVSNGYKTEDRDKLTGSFAKVNNQLLNRSVSTDVLERLDGVTSGLIFNKNSVLGLNQSSISVRGRSTIYANPEPLIVVDNFPYTGEIQNINPNDVESITILKDAAATAIWGTLSGNGVIVITTKTGKYNQPLKVSFNSNITIGNKPDLYYQPILSSGDFIDVEQYLFNQNFYLAKETSSYHPVLSPLVEILIKKRDGLISQEDADKLINNLRNQDVRKDEEKYLYRKSINQQYAVNISGGSSNYQYYVSAGYDKNLSTLVGNKYDRKTFTSNNTFLLLDKKIEVTAGIIFSESNTKDNNTGSLPVNYPYIRLADENGNALIVPSDLRQPYKDTAGRGILLDWNLRPLDELHLQDNSKSLTDYRINIGLKYTIIPGLDANIIYQHNKGFTDYQNFQSQQTYYTRNLINKFTQIDPMGKPNQQVPLGGIMDQSNYKYKANNLRSHLNYNKIWGTSHVLTAIAGAEVRNITTQTTGSRLYGYKKELQSSILPDYLNDLPIYYAPFLPEKIPYINVNKGTIDRYISYFLNAVYTYKNRYSLSASARKDESNIFGVKANQKGVPLWSVGVGWTVSREDYYHIDWLPVLKLRATGGYNGNVDKSVSAYTTANIGSQNVWGALVAAITNPPNTSLQWEKIYMVNIGLDFATPNKRIDGSLEFYSRTGKGLIGYSPLDPTTGNTIFRGNTANMKGKGFDITLNTRNIIKQVKWFSTILISKTTDKVTAYKLKLSSIDNYLTINTINPLEGNPLYSVYSLKWMGLDPQTGDPQGYFNRQISKDYSAIFGSSDFNNLQYCGPANPTLFGSFRNTFSWKQLELSFNITWKAGYYFRRPSIDYNSLFNSSSGHSDFVHRWQKPGDEEFTNVPSLRYTQDLYRDPFYAFSEILVEKGDHIRLQDLQISYDITKKEVSKLPMSLIRLYIYANNIGILWKANNKGIDPDYISGIPNPRTLAIGVSVDF